MKILSLLFAALLLIHPVPASSSEAELEFQTFDAPALTEQDYTAQEWYENQPQLFAVACLASIGMQYEQFPDIAWDHRQTPIYIKTAMLLTAARYSEGFPDIDLDLLLNEDAYIGSVKGEAIYCGWALESETLVLYYILNLDQASWTCQKQAISLDEVFQSVSGDDYDRVDSNDLKEKIDELNEMINAG